MMGITKFFLPNFRFKNVSQIDPKIFKYSDLLIFDIDNTLFFPETIKINKETLEWFSKIRKKYRCICLSNSNTIIKRRPKIEKILGCEVFLSDRKKPSKKLFLEIKKSFPAAKNIFIIGDRIFPDILFGNLNGAVTILVDIISKKERIYIMIARFIEKIIFLH